MPPPYRITVVCLGNICRSPIGEAVIRDRLGRAGLAGQVVVDSAGTGDWHVGGLADPRSTAVLEANGYALDHRVRQIGPKWFPDIDLLLAMDASNYRDLAAMGAVASTDLRMLRSFDPACAGIPEPSPALDVPDPYYGGADGFAEVLAMVERSSDGLISALEQRLRASD